MLIDIKQLVSAYNTLVLSKKYNQIEEDKVATLYKSLIKRINEYHETDNYVLNFSFITDFLRNNSHLLTLSPLNIKKRLVPRILEDLKIYHTTSKSSEIGPFNVIKELGSGQFGKVYLVQDNTQNIFALKQIDLLDKMSTPYKIKKEIDMLKKLSDIKPQIAPRYVTSFIQNNYVNIVQEYINCGTLSEYTKTHKLTTKMKEQIRDIVTRLHKAGIYHKDLHPENILVKCDPKNKKSNPKFIISDFGESKSMKNIHNDDFIFIQDIKDTNKSIDERVDKIPVDSMLFDLIVNDILMSRTSPTLILPPRTNSR
jgi:serine/threonine protein kinase